MKKCSSCRRRPMGLPMKKRRMRGGNKTMKKLGRIGKKLLAKAAKRGDVKALGKKVARRVVGRLDRLADQI